MKEKITKLLMSAFWAAVIFALAGMVTGAVGLKQIGVYLSCASGIISFGIIIALMRIKVKKEDDQ